MRVDCSINVEEVVAVTDIHDGEPCVVYAPAVIPPLFMVDLHVGHSVFDGLSYKATRAGPVTTAYVAPGLSGCS